MSRQQESVDELSAMDSGGRPGPGLVCDGEAEAAADQSPEAQPRKRAASRELSAARSVPAGAASLLFPNFHSNASIPLSSCLREMGKKIGIWGCTGRK